MPPRTVYRRAMFERRAINSTHELVDITTSQAKVSLGVDDHLVYGATSFAAHLLPADAVCAPPARQKDKPQATNATDEIIKSHTAETPTGHP